MGATESDTPWEVGLSTVKVRSRRGQGKDKVRSRQCKYNLNRNYNLMGFDIIEINLVLIQIRKKKPHLGSQEPP